MEMKGRPGKNKSFIQKSYPYHLIVPAFFLYTLFFIIPVIGGVFISLTNWNLFQPGLNFIGLRNYSDIFNNLDFKLAVKNTLIFTAAITVLRNVFAILLALALTNKLKTLVFIRTVFFIPSVLSYVVVGLMFTAAFQMNGLVNQVLNLFGFAVKFEWIVMKETALLTVILEDVWKWTGFYMIIYIAGLNAIPPEYYESSRIDGASYVQQFRYITLPLLIPALMVSIVHSTMGGFKVFEQVLTLTKGGPGHTSTVMGMLVYENFTRGFYGRSTAISLFWSIIIIIVSLVMQKFFKKGESSLS
jgi:raffinose/stachyose/melibiose transport system permease protein